MAQEECLCRSSNLFACIFDQNVHDEYYGYHRGIRSHFYTDRLIYTKDVTVFKDDSTVPQPIPKEEWFDVDVITCAAPYIAKRKHTNGAALLNLFKSRIKNIFEAARDNNVDYLILGAFGCGAFRNPPLIVAEAFRQTIMEQNYFKDFKQIVFAIKPTGTDCPNLNTFRRQFDFYSDSEEAYVWGDRQVNRIEKVSLSWGDLPIYNIDVENDTVILYRRIKSRDGWMRFPDSFFDEKRKPLDSEAKLSLFQFLETIDFTKWNTDERTIFNIESRAIGFFVSESFKCVFDDGTTFYCAYPPQDQFVKMVDYFKSFFSEEDMGPFIYEVTPVDEVTVVLSDDI